MSKKQVIIYITIGIILVLVYWLFFTGGGRGSDQVSPEALMDPQIASAPGAGLPGGPSETALAKQAATRAEQEKLVDQYTASIAQGNNLEDLYFARAQVQEKLQHYRAAAADYQEVINLNPKAVNAFFNLGVVHEKMGLDAEAFQDYSAALRLQPDNYAILNARGLVQVELKQFEPAMHDYNKALELNPQYAQAYFNRGTLYERQKEFAKAQADYTKAIEYSANLPQDALLNDAQKEVARANLIEAYYRRAITYYVTDDFQAALQDANAAINLDPRLVKAFQLRASINDKLGNVAAAANDEATAQTLSLESMLNDDDVEQD